ncbi:MAG: hypothetical protein GF331_19760 [Chitinivibrionales bacterium]|nr:hypothetical protein [Chitinivibrionales bacterium]
MDHRFRSRNRIAASSAITLAVWLSALLAAAGVHAEKRPVGRIFRPVPRPVRTPPSIEQRVRPFLEARTGVRPSVADIGARRPTQSELFAIARSWDDLSDSFKTLYTAAIQPPTGMLVHETPGGHFDILYTTSGINRVDPADTYGYAPSDWRQRVPGANGVPDYIDEVAWACDSAWSMEVGRFAFPRPHPSVSTEYASDRYKVVVRNLDSSTVANGDTVRIGNSLYGQTFPVARDESGIGFSSYFELRCNWNGGEWRDVAGNDYEANPEKAVHITCAHEFFHGVQYAMTHVLASAVDLDYFPEGWIEATAVLMEELAFDSINDYLQYCTGYFRYPQTPVLIGGGYGSSIVAMHFYEHSPGAEGIDFIRRVFLNNYNRPAAFHANLSSAAEAFGTSWSSMLSGFHAGSYFTGARAGSPYFLKDAALLPMWSYREDPADTPMTRATAVIQAYGMQTFSRLRYDWEDDTLLVQVAGRRLSGSVPYDDLWGAHVLLRRKDSLHFDTAMAMQFGTTATDTLRIEPWGAYAEALVVVSNAHGSLSGEVVVAFDSLISELPVPEGIPLTLYPNPVRLRSTRELTIMGPRLIRARVYTVDGQLLFDHSPQRDTSRISWRIDSRDLRPSTCFAAIERRDPASNKTILERRKILIVP